MLDRVRSGFERMSSAGSSSGLSRSSSTATSHLDASVEPLPVSDRVYYDANPLRHGQGAEVRSPLGGLAAIDGRKVPYSYEFVRKHNAQARWLGGNPVLDHKEYKTALKSVKKNAKAEGFTDEQALHLAEHARAIHRQTKSVIAGYEALNNALSKVLEPKTGSLMRSLSGQTPRAAHASLQALYERLTSVEVLGSREHELPSGIWQHVEGSQQHTQGRLAAYEKQTRAAAPQIERNMSGMSSQASTRLSEESEIDADLRRRLEALRAL